MTTGSSDDITGRVKRVIPNRWFSYIAPYRDAVIGGLADIASRLYGLISYARAQTRLASAYGLWLDIFAYDYLQTFLVRNNLGDDAFRLLIQATILKERVTRAGMSSALVAMTGNTPRIFEPWNTYDTGAYSSSLPGGFKCGQFGYGVGRGGYGNMNLPAQVFIDVTRGSPSGLPNVGGYGNVVAGWGTGAIEYLGSLVALTGITDGLIYQLINKTKPTGLITWVRFGFVTPPLRRPCIFGGAGAGVNSQNIAVI